MAQRRPSKRARVGGVVRDSIPLLDDYSTVHAREGRLVRVGNEFHTAPAERVPQRESDHTWSNAASWLPHDDPQYALDPDGDWYDEAVGGDVITQDDVGGQDLPPTAAKKKRVRSKVSVSKKHSNIVIGPNFLQQRPHVVWKDVHRQTYLEEIIRWAGRADFRPAQQCPDCVARGTAVPGPPEYRCRECFLGDLVCQACCVRRHRMHPLHRVEVSYSFFFFRLLT